MWDTVHDSVKHIHYQAANVAYWPCLWVVLQNGWTALIWACDKGWDIVVRDLLSAGADIVAKTNVGGEVTA